jgi:hypothetical protein
MRRILAQLATTSLLLPFLGLSGCLSEPEPVQQAKSFYARIDSADFGGAWEMLTDEDKLAMGKTDFVAALTDSMRLPGFDTILEWKIVRQNGDTTIVGSDRITPNWERLEDIKSRLNRREQLQNLAENGNMPTNRDTTRTIAVIKTPNGPRFHIGLASLKAFEAAKDSIAEGLAKKVTVKFSSAIVENNFQAFFHITGKVMNGADIDLAPVVIKVYLRGKLAGTITLKGHSKVPAKGTYSAEMSAYYENGLTPQKFGTNWDRGAVLLPVSAIRGEVESAKPADRREFERLAVRALGGKTPPVIY